ncbi:hypothetical protein [Microbacterium sp. 179-I 3D3 NHS]|uniref:hypothetical protein n=1 Tax=Microbacterium sp. 179-I 3D3 NHS TaxID=3142382 RepID=UPI0039A12262
MSTQFRTIDDLLAPIIPDWTIRDLLEWLSDDDRAHDESLRRPLGIIEAALTGSPWTGEPSTTALTRSIVSTVGSLPRVRNLRLDDLLPGGGWIRNAPPVDDSAAFSIHAAPPDRERQVQVV